MICIEDLSIQNMMQNHNLAGSISSVGWFSFVTKLMYKAECTENTENLRIDKTL